MTSLFFFLLKCLRWVQGGGVSNVVERSRRARPQAEWRGEGWYAKRAGVSPYLFIIIETNELGNHKRVLICSLSLILRYYVKNKRDIFQKYSLSPKTKIFRGYNPQLGVHVIGRSFGQRTCPSYCIAERNVWTHFKEN